MDDDITAIAHMAKNGDEEAHNTITWAIIGLGNPGKEYTKTRHNVGFCVVDSICSQLSLELHFDKYLNADITLYNGKCNNCSYKLVIAKPLGYMNNSGIVVRDIIKRFSVPTKKCVIITDNVDIGVAQLCFRMKKTKGNTHNGIRSIVSCLGKGDFLRLYVGIGLNRPQQSLSSYVLGKWHHSEHEEYEYAFNIAAKSLIAIPCTDISDIQRGLNSYKKP